MLRSQYDGYQSLYASEFRQDVDNTTIAQAGILWSPDYFPAVTATRQPTHRQLWVLSVVRSEEARCECFGEGQQSFRGDRGV